MLWKKYDGKISTGGRFFLFYDDADVLSVEERELKALIESIDSIQDI